MVSWRFNPPPDWPVPDDHEWLPPPGWSPDPGWPPAPAGWEFWVRPADQPPPSAPPAAPDQAPPPRPGTRRRAPRRSVVVLGAVALAPLMLLMLLLVPRLADRLGSELPDGTRVVFTTEVTPIETLAVGELEGAPVAVFQEYPAADLLVLDLATGEQLQTLPGSPTSSIAIGEVDGAAVAVTADGGLPTARVWDLRTGRLLHTLTGHTDPVSAVATGEVAGTPIAATSSYLDQTVRLWDLSTGEPLAWPFGALRDSGPGEALSIVATRGGPVLVVGRRGGLDLWNLATGGSPTFGGTLTCPDNSLLVEAVPPQTMAVGERDGAPVVVSGCGQAALWDLGTGRMLASLSEEQGSPHAMAAAELDGRPVALVGMFGGPIRIWEMTSGRELGEPVDLYARALATTELDGEVMVVVSDHDRRLLVWPLARHAAG